MGICKIIVPFGQLAAHFLLVLVLNGRGKPPQCIIVAMRALIRLQKRRHISANIVLLYFMLPELLVRLDVKKRPLPITSKLPTLALLGSYLALQSQGLISEDKVEFALFPYCEI